MKIYARFYLHLQKYAPAGKAAEEEIPLEIPGVITVAGFLRFLGISAGDTAVLVNGRSVEGEYVLAEGDRVAFLPLLEGG